MDGRERARNMVLGKHMYFQRRIVSEIIPDLRARARLARARDHSSGMTSQNSNQLVICLRVEPIKDHLEPQGKFEEAELSSNSAPTYPMSEAWMISNVCPTCRRSGEGNACNPTSAFCGSINSI